MTQLKNVGHDFETRPGETGVTVRKGFKWAAVENGTALELWRCDRPHQGDCPELDQRDPSDVKVFCAQQGTGRVVGHWVGQLKDLPARIIELEHEAKSRLYSGLVGSLARAYGKLSDRHYVTALFYARLTDDRIKYAEEQETAERPRKDDPALVELTVELAIDR